MEVRAVSTEAGLVDEDRALVAEARRGDARAFAALVHRHQHRVLAVARMLTGNQADAEDVAQDAFLRAYRGLQSFRGASTFRTWLLQIAANAARTHRARTRARPETTVDDEGPRALDRTPSGERLEAAIEARDRLAQALETLSPDLREAVILRDVEGLEYREIAARLGVPMGTVESRIFRGRARLRAALTAAPGE